MPLMTIGKCFRGRTDVKVATTALAVIATRRISRGHIDVPAAFDGDQMMNVNTQQGLIP